MHGARLDVQHERWGACGRVWGWCNREAPLRICFSPDGTAVCNVECKAMDNCTNPYLSLAALICAGYLGVKRGLRLPKPCDVDPGGLSSAELAEHGIEPLKVQLEDLLLAWEIDQGELYAFLHNTIFQPPFSLLPPPSLSLLSSFPVAFTLALCACIRA